MRKTVTIDLDEALISHTGPIKKIVIREPSYSEYLEIGDPYTVAGTKSGGQVFMVENAEVIKAYIALCMVEPKDPALLEQASARVGRDVKQAVLGFFQPAVETSAASATSETNSPSAASASAQESSAS